MKIRMLQRADYVASVVETMNIYKILIEKSLRNHQYNDQGKGRARIWGFLGRQVVWTGDIWKWLTLVSKTGLGY
jgi:hypothetical protein